MRIKKPFQFKFFFFFNFNIRRQFKPIMLEIIFEIIILKAVFILFVARAKLSQKLSIVFSRNELFCIMNR